MEREHLTGGGTCRLARLIGNCIPVVGFWQCVADQWLSSQLAIAVGEEAPYTAMDTLFTM